MSSRTTTVGADGTYLFDNVRAGRRVRIVAFVGPRAVATAYQLVTLAEERVDLQQRAFVATPASEFDIWATEDTAGSIAGIVRTASGAAAAGARVSIAQTTVSVPTDATGRYAIGGLRSGMHLTLTASAPGFAPVSDTVVVAENSRITQDFSLTEPDTRTRHDTAEEDAVETIVDSALAGGDARVAVEGYTPYPFLHFTSAFTPGAVPGLTSSDSRAPSQTPTGSVTASALGLDGDVSVPLASRGAFSIAARRTPPASLYDRTLDLFAGGAGTSARSRTARYRGGTFATPESVFHDVTIKGDVALTSADRLIVSVYDGRDDLNASRDLPAPMSASTVQVAGAFSLPQDARIEASDISVRTLHGGGASWMRQWSPRISTRVSFGRSEYATTRDRAWLLTSPSTATDLTITSGRGGSGADVETNAIATTTIEASALARFGFEHAVSIGARIASTDATFGLNQELFTAPAGSTGSSALLPLFNRALSGRLTTVFAEDTWRPTTKVTIAPAVRIALYDVDKSAFVQPGVNGVFQLTPFIRAVGAWSMDRHTDLRLVREDLLHGDTAFWTIADGKTIPIARSQEIKGGAVLDMDDVFVDLQGYYRKLDDLTMLAPRLLPGVAPASLLHFGSGTARGVTLIARSTVDRNSFQATYGIATIEYTFPTLEAAPFPASNDRRHDVIVTDTIHFGGGWSAGGTLTASSGRPYTAPTSVEPIWFPTGATASIVRFGAKNSSELDPYARVDVFARRTFHLARFTATLGVTVFNVFDQRNVWYKNYEAAGGILNEDDVRLLRRAVNILLHVAF